MLSVSSSAEAVTALRINRWFIPVLTITGTIAIAPEASP